MDEKQETFSIILLSYIKGRKKKLTGHLNTLDELILITIISQVNLKCNMIHVKFTFTRPTTDCQKSTQIIKWDGQSIGFINDTSVSVTIG